MSHTDVTDEMRDDAYRATHPHCVMCNRECCEEQAVCPSCPWWRNPPRPMRVDGLDFVCSEACKAEYLKPNPEWVAQGEKHEDDA